MNWEKHFELAFDSDTARALHDEDLDVDTDFCAMCGHDWCSVRISKEIEAFVSGKDADYAWDTPKRTAALTPEQQAILEQRGVLSPEEIHKLSAKKRHEGTEARSHEGEEGKLSCHSDYVDGDTAKKIQKEKLGKDAEKLVKLNTAPAHNVPTHDSLI